MFNELQKADEYIRKKASSVDSTYRHHYHLMAPIGWINDPNGFVFFKGEYHLFYQYNPYDSAWGPMYWGHAKSKDLVHWEHLPVALAPSEKYDIDGCFSGSAIEKDGKLYLIYTGHVENENFKREVQCLAVSEDGIHFEKYAGNPIIDERQIEGVAAIDDFRDPKVFKRNDSYFTVVASKTPDERGEILLFKSDDLLEWSFVSILLRGDKNQGIMWECPDLFHLDGKDVLIMSPIKMTPKGVSYHNTNSTVAFIGTMNWETGKLEVENYHEIDSGLDFYAPQTCEAAQGRRIMVAWMQMWNRTIPTHDMGHGWSGAMTLPRVLRVKGNRLTQAPIDSIYENIIQELELNQIEIFETPFVKQKLISDTAYIKMIFDIEDAQSFKIDYAKSANQSLMIVFDKETQLLTVSRENFGKKIVGIEPEQLVSRQLKVASPSKQLTLEIFRDTSSLEIFVNNSQTLSFTFYEEVSGSDLLISSKGQLRLTQLIAGKIK
ncbi:MULTISPECIES: glycoside hydrolase family 32 protein [unclassified Enterococcus]|uniref:glycoside hydrolase family 32 protein n=1 Tax=unclassified Enterococcus TaxID=2608891 RepID=UPI0015568B52|nr:MULTISPECIES: glycoside hydrolase family 32 protein [unclassified Enterococcus]MBS7577781.1 glycoside hydrolase family 32 protein [Enterococcus sp. MMGLQ5-2]MBS7585041.1 glycoside hydrolase family 32 protein [Enterococcus sp. MMGLQ5-1]NPD12897.1 glycoside hydrolase family 32 protein [Enterococcus sp. MMGLQ5-1]NPD37611.1 glycoside hydrolase family 32 protein [Enterococcus sp. MMGLQ5-2]